MNDGQATTTVPRGKLEGKTWTYLEESKMGEQTVATRYVITELSPTAYTWKWEVKAGASWSTVAEGKSTK